MNETTVLVTSFRIYLDISRAFLNPSILPNEKGNRKIFDRTKFICLKNYENFNSISFQEFFFHRTLNIILFFPNILFRNSNISEI